MSADIHLMDGGKITPPGEGNPKLVEELEWLLEAAKSGRISGMGYAIVFSDKATNNRYVGTISRAEVGAIFAVMTRISRELDA